MFSRVVVIPCLILSLALCGCQSRQAYSPSPNPHADFGERVQTCWTENQLAVEDWFEEHYCLKNALVLTGLTVVTAVFVAGYLVIKMESDDSDSVFDE